MTCPVIRTHRLTITGHRADDLDALAAMWSDPAITGPIGIAPRSREEVWLRLLRSAGQWSLFGYGSWVLRDRATATLVGEAGLLEARRAIDPPLACPEAGWALAPAYQNRGLAYEAMVAVLAWSDRAGLGTTCCIIDPGNAASLRLAGRLGYQTRRTVSYHEAAVRVLERAGYREAG